MKTERIGLRIDSDLKNNLQIKAYLSNRSLSNYIELILKNHIISGGNDDNIQSNKFNKQ